MLLVSGCLAGINCKYNGENNKVGYVVDLVAAGKAIPFCPEQLGGLCTPRGPVELVGGDGTDVLDGRGRALTTEGQDVTEAFIRGAYESLALAKMVECSKAILKERSPSCGSSMIYDGSHGHNLIKGKGVTAALLAREGIEVFSEENWQG